MVQNGEIEKLLRPGKFLSEPPNNLELILRYKDAHFEGFINSTKSKYDSYCYLRDLLSILIIRSLKIYLT